MAGVITEIAIECGVSEQAVRAWCRRNHVAKDAKGSFAISESQKTAIYQHYLGVERKQVSQQAKASCETCETTLIAMLQGELDRKSEQLAVKDMVFDEALAAYNAKKTKTRDKIPDYYEHIRQSKQEKLFHEAIFQIGNMSDCGCGTPDGERAAAALKDFAESFAERNPHLRVFNMVLHMDEATPHLHVDFIPVATEQSRGLSTRVSMKQALKQQGFVGVGRKQTEWAAWMEREKEALTEIAQRHDFEIISLGTNRPHMDLPQFKEAAARLEAVQQQTAAVEREVAELERQRDALKGTVRLLKEADRVNAPLHDIQPEKTLTGAVKGVTVDQVEQLKKMALRSVTDRHKVQELTEENTRLRSQVPSMKKRLEEAQRQQRLEQENRRLRDENYYLQSELQEERSFTERLTDGIGRMLDFLEEHLPERLRPLLEKARELLPDPEIGQQQEQQQHQRGMGGMEL